MVMGLHNLHARKIIHRDIKCANIFLTKDGMVKLGDMNVSKIAKAGILKTQTGTPYYASPEVWQDKPYDNKSDMWSMGAVLYELVALNPPFTARDMKGLFSRVIKGVYPKIPHHYSQGLSDMIASLLQVDPKKRPTCEEILAMPIFTDKFNEMKKQHQDAPEPQADDMLGTIRLPVNLNLIQRNLPSSNYDSDRLLRVKSE
jgi:NIMA (never in mitosis gene a)-related kinase